MAIQGSINALIGTVLGAGAFKGKKSTTPEKVETPEAEPIKVASQKGVEQANITTEQAPSVTSAMVNNAMYGRLNTPIYDYQATTYAMQKMAENGQAKFSQRKAVRNRIVSKKGGKK